MSIRRALCPSIGVALLCALGCSSSPRQVTEPNKTTRCATPQECWSVLEKASLDQDWPGFLECVSERSQNTLVGQTSFALSMHTNDQDSAAALFKKHNLANVDIMGVMQVSDRPGGRGVHYAWQMIGARVSDKMSFVRDAYDLLDEEHREGIFPKFQADLKLRNVVIKEDVADAQLAVKGQTVPVRFHLKAKSWVFELTPDPPRLTAEQRAAIEALGEVGKFVGRQELPTEFTLTLGGQDKDLKPVHHLTYLVTLILDDSDVTNAGLEYIKPLKKLERLSLKGTRITAKGLRLLADLPALTTLDLRNTDLAESDLVELKKRLPACDIQTGFDIEATSFNSDDRYFTLDYGGAVLVLAGTSFENIEAMRKSLGTRDVFLLLRSRQVAVMTLQRGFVQPVRDLDVLDMKQLPYVALFTSESPAVPTILRGSIDSDHLTRLLRSIPAFKEKSEAEETASQVTLNYPSMKIVRTGESTLLSTGHQPGQSPIGDGQIARIYIRSAEGQRYFLPKLSEADVARSANNSGETPSMSKDSAGNSIFRARGTATVLIFRDGKLRFARIDGGLRVSSDNRVYRRLFHTPFFVLDKFFGKPASISKK